MVGGCEREEAGLTRRAGGVRKSWAASEGGSENKSVAARAPANLVQQTRDQLAAAEKEAATRRAQVAAL